MRTRLALVVWTAMAGLSWAQVPSDPPANYERQSLRGFTVFIAPEAQDRTARSGGRAPAEILELELDDLRRVLPTHLFKVLQAVPVFAEWDKAEDGRPDVIARYFGATREQMRDNGRPMHLAGAIEIMTLKRIGAMRHVGSKFQQIITLHEMAHAIHHRTIGMDNAEVQAVYKQAMDRKLYDRALDRFNRIGPAYARTNAREYFAELTCAYLDTCNSYPFNYTELQYHDPAGFRLMERMYKTADGLANFGTTPAKTTPVVPATVAPRVDVVAERDAMLALDKLRALVAANKRDEVTPKLQLLVRQYPATYAGREAQAMLDQWK